jgi:hypothetical protein
VDAVDVARTTLTIAPPAAGHWYRGISLGVLPSRIKDGQLIVDVPAQRRIRALHIAGLETVEATPVALRGAGDLGGRLLAVSAADASGQFATPVVAVPPVAQRGQIPPTLTGAAFENRVLQLPDVAGRKLRIALVTGDSPDEFTAVGIAAGAVTAWASPIPRDLIVKGPDGATLWEFPGELLPGTTPPTIDVTVGLQGSIDGMLSAGVRLAGEITIQAKYPSRIGVALPSVRGALVRSVRGITRAELAGSSTPVSIEGDPLPTAVPSSVIADVRVTYAGIRLAEMSDLLPTDRAVEGIVVGAHPEIRTLPPEALRGEQVARIGIVGRAMDDVELTVQLVDPNSADPDPVAPPAVLAVTPTAPGQELGVAWATFDPPVEAERPLAISVTATRGTFLWVADPVPRVRIAIVDPDPGGRPILLAGATLLTLDAPELSVNRASLPGLPFGDGGARLVFASALYCTVELTDIELRYDRPGGA